MGLLDLIKPNKERREEVAVTRSALDAAKDPNAKDDGAIGRLIQMILDVGLDGRGPIDSASELAERARKATGSPEQAVDRIVQRATIGGGLGGVMTGLGGIVTMPIALPANVLEFYVQATRMVGAVAILRGYDLKQEHIRTAVLLTLVGSQADEVLKKAGAATASGRITSFALRGMPPAALMIINKAVGFRLMGNVGGALVARLGRSIPIAGGLVGGGIDVMMMRKIAAQARKEFPPVGSEEAERAARDAQDGAPR